MHPSMARLGNVRPLLLCYLVPRGLERPSTARLGNVSPFAIGFQFAPRLDPTFRFSRDVSLAKLTVNIRIPWPALMGQMRAKAAVL